MAYSSYPRPNPAMISPGVNPYPTYEPILTPPLVTTLNLPKLPHGPRPQSSLPKPLQATHILSTHIITAAWPRCRSELYVEAKHTPPANETKDQRKARVNREFQEMAVKKRAAERRDQPGVPERKEVLYTVYNRYRRKGEWDPEGLTLIVTHAVGFPKEIWEPTFAWIVQRTESAKRVKVNEIWAFESVNHGDSALVNEGKLGFIHSWAESARDLIHFLLYYLPTNPGASDGEELPTHLERLSEGIAQNRRKKGFAGERNLVGLGHSAGMSAMFLSALWEPNLYHSLCAVEPIVMQIEVNDAPIFDQWVKGAIGRRASWSSIEEARKLYEAAPSFSYWDPAVLDTFIRYGITEDKNHPPSGVKLKGPVILEGMSFSERQNGCHIYEMLSTMNPKITMHFIYSSKDSTATGGAVSSAHTAWKRPVNSSNVRIPVTHLMVQESPRKVSEAIVKFLEEKYGPALVHEVELARL